MDPITWVPLASTTVTALAVLGAQWMSNRRAAAERQEQADRERERWVREDRDRSYEHRRNAYVAYYSLFRRYQQEVENWDGPADPTDDYLSGLYEAYLTVRIYGTNDTSLAAQVMYQCVWDQLYGGGMRSEPVSIDQLMVAYLSQVRRDLAIPDGITDA